MEREKIIKAVKTAKEKSKKRKFTQSIDLSINLKDIDLKKPENKLNEEVLLPNGKGKETRIGVIGTELVEKAKASGVTTITKEKLEKLSKKKREAKKLASEHDFFVAQADMMPLVGRFLGPVLAPRNKMPKPFPASIDINPVIKRYERIVRVYLKDHPILPVLVGSEEMSDEKIAENIEAVLKVIERKLPKGLQHITNMYVKTTMGPAVRIE